jgi:putative DNA primase/helicase
MGRQRVSLLEEALGYAAIGWRVHPCRADNKRPLTRWGTEATTNEFTIEQMWTRWPDALIAVCTGSGLAVVDVDPRNGGMYDDDLARTLTSETRSGGWHHWFTSRSPVANAVGLIPGVDIRGDGGYVIAPPSPGWSWMNDVPMLPLPRVITDLMEIRRSERRNGPGFEPAAPGTVGEGYRHDYMVRFAGFAIGVLEIEDADELVATCLEEYQRACWPADAPDRNIARIARSILRKDRGD